jgi:hypothetical protein
MGAIAELLSVDHDRLDALLAKATAAPDAIEGEAYAAFRAGLAKHIGMEEKILFAAARRATLPPALADKLARLRADHGQLTLLLVPTPTPAIAAQLRAILEPHNVVEECDGGVYEACEALLGADAPPILAKLQSAPEVPMRPYYDGPLLDRKLQR